MLDLPKALPQGFGYVHLLVPGVRQSIRYHTPENFMGRQIEGYHKPYTVLTLEAIEALTKVQQAANVLGYDLLIYDGYRPLRACHDFVGWLKNDRCDQASLYFPHISKENIKSHRYFSVASNHCSGNTVDLSLIRRDKPLAAKPKWSYRSYQGHRVPYCDDGSIDMYTSFDLFDEVSHYESPYVPTAFQERRHMLRTLMEHHGFVGAENEWWHFDLKHSTSNQSHDFVF